MADVFSKRVRSRVMAKVLSRGNRSTELPAIKVFRAHGFTGWRRAFPLYGNPDFVFPCLKVAIFIDGCFWHGCPGHCRMPSSNVSYWRAKIARNKKRDRLVSAILRDSHWTVLRIWEHEFRNPAQVLRRFKRELAQPASRQK